MATSQPDNLGQDLSAYLDGELSAERAREIERLLAERPELRQQLEALRAVANQLSRLPRHRAPDALVAAMQRAAERHELFDSPRPVRHARILRIGLRITAVAAMLVGGVFIGWNALRSSTTAPGDGVNVGHPDAHAPAREFGRVATSEELHRKDGVARSPVLSDGPTAAEVPVTADKLAAAEPAARPAVGLIAEDYSYGTAMLGEADAPGVSEEPTVAAVPVDSAEQLGWPSVDADADELVESTVRHLDTYAQADDQVIRALDVVVRPGSVEQYQAVCAVLGRTAGGGPGEVSGGGVAGTAGRDHHHGARATQLATQPAQQVVWKTPLSEVPALLTALEAQAPQQVWVDGQRADESLRAKLVAMSPTDTTIVAGEDYKLHAGVAVQTTRDAAWRTRQPSSPESAGGVGARGRGAVARRGIVGKSQVTSPESAETQPAEKAAAADMERRERSETSPPASAAAPRAGGRGGGGRTTADAATSPPPAPAVGATVAPATQPVGEAEGADERGFVALRREASRELQDAPQERFRELRRTGDESRPGAVREVIRRVLLGFRRTFAPPPPPPEPEVMIRVTVEPPASQPASQPAPPTP